MFSDIVKVNDKHVTQEKYHKPKIHASIDAYEKVSQQLADVFYALAGGEKEFLAVLCPFVYKYRCMIFHIISFI